MNLLKKFKETLLSVVPIMAIVLLLGITVVPLGAGKIVQFIVGGVLLIVGLTFFLTGVDLGILPIGERSGAALTSKKNLPLLLVVSFFIGLMITIAEPDVQVLADQIRGVSPDVNKWVLVLMIGVGIGLFVMLGLLRTVLSIPLKVILWIAYPLVFVLAFLCSKEFQGVAFDAGGATTGPMTVPFIMALGVGVATVRVSKSNKTNDDSFGLTGIASIGPIVAVCIYGILLKFTNGSLDNAAEITGSLPVSEGVEKIEQTVVSQNGIVGSLKIFMETFPLVVKEVLKALLPLVSLFVLFQIFLLKMPPFQVWKMFLGVTYSFLGLILFLTGVQGGFMPVGEFLGKSLGNLALGSKGYLVLLIIVGMVFGAVVVMAEPAVWILTEQVESVSGGTIKRKIMLVTLSLGVALSIGLSMLRVYYRFSLRWILIPGYSLALILSIFCPSLWTGIAFDSGGVASGPMTSTFILSFALGAAMSCGGNPVTDAFGVIALVAMTPLIAIQILGIIFRIINRGGKK